MSFPPSFQNHLWAFILIVTRAINFLRQKLHNVAFSVTRITFNARKFTTQYKPFTSAHSSHIWKNTSMLIIAQLPEQKLSEMSAFFKEKCLQCPNFFNKKYPKFGQGTILWDGRRFSRHYTHFLSADVLCERPHIYVWFSRKVGLRFLLKFN